MAEVWVKVRGGTWEILGKDRFPNSPPQGVTATAGQRGPESITFVVDRPSRERHHDLAGWTECEYRDGATVMWSGRIREAPRQHGQSDKITVVGTGWWQHWMDQDFQGVLVHNRIGDWKDYREHDRADVYPWVPDFNITIGEGVAKIVLPSGAAVPASAAGGIYFDAGTGCMNGIAIAYTAGAWTGVSFNLILLSVDTWDLSEFGWQYSTFDTAPLATSSPQAWYGPNNPPSRAYVIYVQCGTPMTAPADDSCWIEFTVLRPHGSLDFLVNGITDVTNDLRASDAVSLMRRSAPLLSNDESMINTSSFVIPELWVPEMKPAAQVAEAAASFEDYNLSIDPDRRVVFKPKDTFPTLMLAPGMGVELVDSSADSVDDVYNRAHCNAIDANGRRILVSRVAQSNLRKIKFQQASDNWDFEQAAAAPWTVGGQATVDTNNPITGTKSLRGLGGAARADASRSITYTGPGGIGISTEQTVWALGSFVLKFKVKNLVAGPTPFIARMMNPYGGSSAKMPICELYGSVGSADGTVTYQMPFIVPARAPGSVIGIINFTISWYSAANDLRFDDFELFVNLSTPADLSGTFVDAEMPVSALLTTAGAERLLDVYLANHARPSYRGSFTAKHGSVLRSEGGGWGLLRPVELLRMTNRKIIIPDERDPFTGDMGRIGTIAGVTYAEADNTAQVTLDDRRTNLDVFMNRLAAVQQQMGLT